MSQENVELVSEIHRRLNTRESLRDLIDVDFEYVNPPNAVEAGTARGRGTLRRVLEVYPDFRIDVERFLDAGEDVVVIGIARGTGASGLRTEWRQGYVWSVRDGRAVRMRWFNDAEEALKAVGIED